MTQLVEHDSLKASRILGAARELVLEHGIRKVTIAEIARAAGVGKGTVYLYWSTKEDLLLGLVGREILLSLQEIRAGLVADPALVRPSRLAPLILRMTLARPLTRRLHAGEEDTLRLMAHHAASRETFSRASPSALGTAVLGVLREHGLARDDRPMSDQAYALHSLLTGFFVSGTVPAFAGPETEHEPDRILADTVALFLDPVEEVCEERALDEALPRVLAAFDQVIEELLEHLNGLTVSSTVP